MVILKRNYEIILKVAELNSISEAAKKLYISQPAVSKAIKDVENTLATPIFSRTKFKGIAITEEGALIIKHLRAMLAEEENLIQTIASFSGNRTGTVKIGTLSSFANTVLIDIIGELKTAFPDLKIVFYEGTTRDIRKWLKEGLIHLGIVVNIPDYKSLNRQLIYEDTVVAISKSENVDNVIFINDSNEDLLVCKSGYDGLLEEFNKFNINIAESNILDNIVALIKMVENNLGIGIISKLSLSGFKTNLRIIDLYPTFLNKYYVIEQKERPQNALSQIVKERIINRTKQLALKKK